MDPVRLSHCSPSPISLSVGGSHFLTPPSPPTSTPRIHSSHLLVFLLILAAAFWLVQLLRSVCNLFSFWDIQVFYREALHIPPVSWARVSVWRGAVSGGRGQGKSGGCTDGRAHLESRQKASLTPTLDP